MHRFLLALLLLTAACNSQKETSGDTSSVPGEDEISAFHEEVISIHDDVMMKMGDMHNEKLRLTALVENEADSAKTEELTTAIQALEEADESMMQWMRNFNPQQFADDPKALYDYYTEEKTRIESVAALINSSLEQAASL